jgi:hypothetical protein
MGGVKVFKREMCSNINAFLYFIFKDFLIPEDEVKSKKVTITSCNYFQSNSYFRESRVFSARVLKEQKREWSGGES